MGHLSLYVGMLHRAEQTLADSFGVIGEAHAADADVPETCRLLADLSESHVRRLAPIAKRYGEEREAGEVTEPDRLPAEGLASGREGPVGLLRDLQDLQVLATLVQSSWTVIYQAAQGARDAELIGTAEAANAETSRQLTWLTTRMKAAAPQALLAG